MQRQLLNKIIKGANAYGYNEWCAILPGNSTVEIRDFEMPESGYRQALVRTKATTIWGSDIRCIYREHVGKGAEDYIPGTIAGHEPCGIYREMPQGSNVSRKAAG